MRVVRLRARTKFFLACWALALVIVGVPYRYYALADAQLTKAVDECENYASDRRGGGLPEKLKAEAASERELAIMARGTGEMFYGSEGVRLDNTKYVVACDPQNLRRVRTGIRLVAHQQAVVDSVTEANRWAEFSLVACLLAALLGFAGAIPFAWYFLLDRVQEVSKAIRG